MKIYDRTKKILLGGLIVALLLPALLTAKSDESATKSVEVAFYAHLYAQPSSHSDLIKILGDGVELTVLAKKGNWYHVSYDDMTGWIAEEEIVTASLSPKSKNRVTVSVSNKSDTGADHSVSFWILLGVTMLLSVSGYFFFRRWRENKMYQEMATRTQTTKLACVVKNTEKSITIVADEDKILRTDVSNIYLNMSLFFSNLGFAVDFCSRLDSMDSVYANPPTLILVDYHFKKDIIKRIAKILAGSSYTQQIPVIFYNIPRPERVHAPTELVNLYYLNESFTDNEILKILATTMQYQDQRVIEESFLRGKITEEGLYNIFNLFEMSRRTGHLHLYDKDKKEIGVISFREGIISYGEYGSFHGREAVLQLLNRRDGYFEFILDNKDKPSNCQINPMEIMLYSVKTADENQAHNQKAFSSYAS